MFLTVNKDINKLLAALYLFETIKNTFNNNKFIFLLLLLPKNVKYFVILLFLAMETYSDGWEEFKTALANTKKKLLKRPNIRESLPVLKNLALKMSDQDQHAHSALCYMELAIIYKNIGDKINEQEYFAKAARLFGQCQLEMRQCEMRIDSNYGVMMETLYLRTAEASEKDQYHVGIIVCELAHKLIDFEQYWLAFEYLVKGRRSLIVPFFFEKKFSLCTSYFTFSQPPSPRSHLHAKDHHGQVDTLFD